MNTIYKTKVASPYQPTRKTTPAVTKQHPAEAEIAKCMGAYDFTAVFEKDTHAKEMFKNIPNLIAFVCTIKRGGVAIGQGKGMSVLNQANKYVEKTVQTVWNYALIDAISKTTRILDSFHSTTDFKMPEVAPLPSYEIKDSYESEMITEKQRSYLLELVNTSSIISDEEKNHWSSTIDDLTKDEASEAIQSFKN